MPFDRRFETQGFSILQSGSGHLNGFRNRRIVVAELDVDMDAAGIVESIEFGFNFYDGSNINHSDER